MKAVREVTLLITLCVLAQVVVGNIPIYGQFGGSNGQRSGYTTPASLGQLTTPQITSAFTFTNNSAGGYIRYGSATPLVDSQGYLIWDAETGANNDFVLVNISCQTGSIEQMIYPPLTEMFFSFTGMGWNDDLIIESVVGDTYIYHQQNATWVEIPATEFQIVGQDGVLFFIDEIKVDNSGSYIQITARDPTYLNVLWSVSTEYPMTTLLDSIISQKDGSLIVNTNKGLITVNPTTGAITNWNPLNNNPIVSYAGICSNHDGQVLLQTQNTIISLVDPTEGVIWSFNSSTYESATTYYSYSFCFSDATSLLTFTTNDDHWAVKLSATGEFIWRADDISDDIMLVESGMYSFRNNITLLDMQTGVPIWEYVHSDPDCVAIPFSEQSLFLACSFHGYGLVIGNTGGMCQIADQEECETFTVDVTSYGNTRVAYACGWCSETNSCVDATCPQLEGECCSSSSSLVPCGPLVYSDIYSFCMPEGMAIWPWLLIGGVVVLLVVIVIVVVFVLVYRREKQKRQYDKITDDQDDL